MSSIDVNKCLPPELTIESVDDILYRIGLCFTSVRVRPKRQRIDHPLVVFIITLIFASERVVSFKCGPKNESMFQILGDVGYLFGARLYGICYIFSSILIFGSQLVYYTNNRNGIKPTFLRVFQMMTGRVPPKVLGLKKEKHILYLIKITKNLNYFFTNQ